MIFVEIIILLLLVYIIYLLSYSMIFGAPYAALSQKRIQIMMKMIGKNDGKKFVDLGSGDGRIVIAAAKNNLIATGFEINPLIYLISLLNLKKAKDINAKIQLKNYWKENLSEFDYVVVWGVKPMMKRLEKKLQKELKPGATVISNHQQFPNWQYKKAVNDVFLYKH